VPEIGFDEAGRGCFFGPIMAGAVCLPDESVWPTEFVKIAPKIKDSKKISPKKRKEYFDIICKYMGQYYGVGSVDAEEINRNGIQWANREAFARALSCLIKSGAEAEMPNEQSYRFLVDGEISFVNKDNRELPCEVLEEKLIVEGDSKYLAIGMASILAKVTHDLWIEDWCKNNSILAERYGMASCKGYGTSLHRNGLKQWGGCAGHRTLFIRNWIPDNLRSNEDQTEKKGPKKEIKNNMFEKCLIIC
jgi:ribonuclease HII